MGRSSSANPFLTKSQLYQWGFFALVVFLDHLTKWWATRQGLIVQNGGVSFGLGEGLPTPVVTTTGVVLVIFLEIWLWRWWSKHPVAGGVFFGGAWGNILDRVLYDGVRDWLSLPGTGLKNNLADWAIALGVLVLVYQEAAQYLSHRKKNT